MSLCFYVSYVYNTFFGLILEMEILYHVIIMLILGIGNPGVTSDLPHSHMILFGRLRLWKWSGTCGHNQGPSSSQTVASYGETVQDRRPGGGLGVRRRRGGRAGECSLFCCSCSCLVVRK